MLYPLTCSLCRITSQLLLANAPSMQCTIKQFAAQANTCTKRQPHGSSQVREPEHLAKSTTVSPKPSHLNWTWLLDSHYTGFQGSKTQTLAGLLFSLHVSWGCPVQNQTYFANVPWDLIFFVHTLYLVALGRCSLSLCTFFSLQGKAVWGNNPYWVQDEHGCSAKLWDKAYGRTGWDI